MKSKVKFFVLGFVVCLMLGGLVYGANQVAEVYFSNFAIKLNGNQYNPEMPVLNYQGRTYLALRELGTVLGNKVDFADNTIIVNNSDYVTPKSEYGLNELYKYTDKDKSYELTITGIKTTTERNKYSDQEPSQVLIIDYTYKNVSGEDLYIFSFNFKLVDEQGELAEPYPLICTYYPQSIPAGATCKAQMCFGINNKSSNISLYYYDNMFGAKDTIFNLDI